MARRRRVKSMAEGTAHYHLVSRASNRQFLFRNARTKDKLMELVRRAAEFSGIKLEACAMMKTAKELFAIWYNREFGYSGSVWKNEFRKGCLPNSSRAYMTSGSHRAGLLR